MKPGLEKTRLLLERLGNPQLSLACIHIAGTNGKGSVAALCDSVLVEAGYPCGRYTSPHLNSINERFRVNGLPVSDDKLVEGASRVCEAIRALENESDVTVTFFEAMTVLAFCIFNDAGIRLAAVETGLGGRLDATNVVDPLVSVITRVGLDHCEWLGNSLEEIAAEKAGIIKPGRPVVLAGNREEVVSVVSGRAAACGSPLFMAEAMVSITRISGDLNSQTVKISTEQRDLPKIAVPLSAKYQLENIAAALCALELLHGMGVEISDGAFVRGLAKVGWKGRFQKVSDSPVVILDGAHNPDAAAALFQSLKQCSLKENLFLVAGFCGEKNAIEFLKRLQPAVRAGFAVKVDNPRALPAGDVAVLMSSAGIREVSEEASVTEALEKAVGSAAGEGGAVLVTGSLFLVAEALAYFEGDDSGGRRLNEERL